MIQSLYIHLPFCNHICSYCDFTKGYYTKKEKQNYLSSLKKEIASYSIKDPLKTIYIGGGTPSSLEKELLETLFEMIKPIPKEKDLEFTFECNIEDITEELLKLLKASGVNRLSIGVESFLPKIEQLLGRKSCANKQEKILLAKKYFKNISVDWMYGVRGQTKKDIQKDLEEFLKLKVPHISCYALILEQHTILSVSKYQEIEEELVATMYETISKALKEHGYIHYEISNFSLPGYESRHNLTYWHNEPYYGVGLGASGYVKKKRYTNTKSMTNYQKGNIRSYEEIVDQKLDMEYEMILNLRLKEGVSKSNFKKKFGKEIKEVFDVKKLKETKDSYVIPEEEFFISNAILCDFVE